MAVIEYFYRTSGNESIWFQYNEDADEYHLHVQEGHIVFGDSDWSEIRNRMSDFSQAVEIRKELRK